MADITKRYGLRSDYKIEYDPYLSRRYQALILTGVIVMGACEPRDMVKAVQKTTSMIESAISYRRNQILTVERSSSNRLRSHEDGR